MLIATRERILGEVLVQTGLVEGFAAFVQVEDCSASASSTARISSSSKILQRLHQNVVAKVGYQFQNNNWSSYGYLDAVNGPTFSSSFMRRFGVRCFKKIIISNFKLSFLGVELDWWYSWSNQYSVGSTARAVHNCISWLFKL